MKVFTEWLYSSAFWATLIFLIGGFAVLGVLRWFKNKYTNDEKVTGKTSTFVHVVSDIINAAVIGVMILGILQANGINVSSALAGIGIVSIIVGLALQDYLKDVIMGVHILSDHSFEVGDVVDYNGFVGIVKGFTIKTTQLEGLNNSEIMTICNRNITEIIRRGDWFDVDVPLPYELDVRQAHTVMMHICEKVKSMPQVNGCEYKGTQEFKDSSILYRFRIFCRPQNRNDVRRAALGIVLEMLTEKNISIPYNQLDVHTR